MDVKQERLQLRVDSAAKTRLEEAAAASHLTLTSFVLQAAQQRADIVLADRPLIHLDSDAVEAFLEALERPAEANPQLLAALGRPAQVEWVD